nr:hypothetical protein BaRGS_031307 [Batillaria attramentaria]
MLGWMNIRAGHEEAIMPDLTSKDNPSADWRNMRRIIAEDPEWSLATVPLLTELCIKYVIANFERAARV